MDSDSLRQTFAQRFASALSYSTLITVATQVLGFARSLIIARILAPTDLGLYGIVLTIISGLEVFTNFGVQQVVITTTIEDDDQKQRWTSTA